MNSEKIRNWDGTQTWIPETIYRPQDEEQIAGLIQQAVEGQNRIRAVGSALSWSDIIDLPENAILFDKMDKVLNVDRDKQQVRVQAGARLKDVNDVLAELDTYLNGNDYCKFWWLPYTDKIQVYTFNKTNKPRKGGGFTGLMDQSGISGILFTALIKLGRSIPRLVPFLHNTVQNIHYHPHQRVDRSDKVIKVSSSIPIHQETEYAIPVGLAAKAIDETRKMILAADYKVNFPMEVRFVAADDIPMSPANGRNSCYIGAYVSDLKWAQKYFEEFENLISDYEGRPHWGKSFSRTHDEIRKLYPAYDQFNDLRQSCDPNGLFRNSFVDRVFPDIHII